MFAPIPTGRMDAGSLPKHMTAPESSRAHVCSHAALTATKLRPLPTCSGVNCFVYCPFRSLTSQHQRDPPESMAQVRLPPVEIAVKVRLPGTGTGTASEFGIETIVATNPLGRSASANRCKATKWGHYYQVSTRDAWACKPPSALSCCH